MKRFSRYKLNKISDGLDYWFDKSNQDDVYNGLNWYKDANRLVVDLSKKYNVSKLKVASVISALSPRNKWDQNIIDAELVINSFKSNIHHSHIKVCTFDSNKIKAFNILSGCAEIKDSSRKTYSFVSNICDLNENFVTVDVWYLRACGTYTSIPETPNKTQYDQIVDLTINKANKLGIRGYEYQAIVWCSIRNK
jgi:hypothetical protein